MVIYKATPDTTGIITVTPAPSPTSLKRPWPTIPDTIIGTMAVVVAESAATVMLMVGESMMKSPGQEWAERSSEHEREDGPHRAHDFD